MNSSNEGGDAAREIARVASRMAAIVDKPAGAGNSLRHATQKSCVAAPVFPTHKKCAPQSGRIA
jgi:hypothetical protein